MKTFNMFVAGFFIVLAIINTIIGKEIIAMIDVVLTFLCIALAKLDECLDRGYIIIGITKGKDDEL